MSKEEVINRIINEHRLIEGMLYDSINVILSYSMESIYDQEDEFRRQVSRFLDNFKKLKEPHYQFEESSFFPLLPSQYRGVVEDLVNEHGLIIKLIGEVMNALTESNFKSVLGLLRKVYDIGVSHMKKENELIKVLQSETKI